MCYYNNNWLTCENDKNIINNEINMLWLCLVDSMNIFIYTLCSYALSLSLNNYFVCLKILFIAHIPDGILINKLLFCSNKYVEL